MSRTPVSQQAGRRVASRAPTASSVIAARQLAIETMSPKLLRLFNKLETQVNDLRTTNLRYYYKIGQICAEAQADPGAYAGRDGTPGLQLIQKAMSLQGRVISRCIQFVGMYDADQFEALLALKNETTSFQLNWGHVVYLLTVSSADKRESLAQEAVTKLWDPSALHTTIKKRLNREGGHGRTHAMPKTPMAMIRQVVKFSDTWVNKSTKVWAGEGEDDSVFAHLMQLPGSEVEEDMIEEATRAIELHVQMASLAVSNQAALERIKEYLTKAKADYDASEAVPATTGTKRRLDLSQPAAEGETVAAKPRRRREAATAAAE